MASMYRGFSLFLYKVLEHNPRKRQGFTVYKLYKTQGKQAKAELDAHMYLHIYCCNLSVLVYTTSVLTLWLLVLFACSYRGIKGT